MDIESSENLGLAKMVKENEPLVRIFCEEYGVKLLTTGSTFETGFLEPLYIFSDNLGGYTIAGIKRSLNLVPFPR